MYSIIVTNNLKVEKEINKSGVTVYYYPSYSSIDILCKARDLIHSGYKLLTHPIVSSVKPNETHVKTIVLSKKCDNVDFLSVNLIEEAIKLTEKFLKLPKKHITKKIKEDLELIDYDLISSSMSNIL